MNFEDVRIGQKVKVVKNWSFYQSFHNQVVDVVALDTVNQRIHVEFELRRDSGLASDVQLVSDVVEEVVEKPDDTVKEKLRQIEKLVAEVKQILG